MKHCATLTCLTLTLALAGGIFFPASAAAQVVQNPYPPPIIVNPAPAPSITYCPPVAPRVSYYPAPTITYYQPPVTVYSPPPAAVYVPAPTYVTTPGTVTTRSYLGLGIFRPFGVNRDVYYSPGRTYIYP